MIVMHASCRILAIPETLPLERSLQGPISFVPPSPSMHILRTSRSPPFRRSPDSSDSRATRRGTRTDELKSFPVRTKKVRKKENAKASGEFVHSALRTVMRFQPGKRYAESLKILSGKNERCRNLGNSARRSNRTMNDSHDHPSK